MLHYLHLLLDTNSSQSMIQEGFVSTPSVHVHLPHSTSSPLLQVHLLHAHTGIEILKSPSQQLLLRMWLINHIQ